MAVASLIDSRRLTGPNLYSEGPGAVAEVRFDDDTSSRERFVARWRSLVEVGMRSLGWTGEVHVRLFDGGPGRQGTELMIAAPHDGLYAATELNEWAIELAAADGDGDGAEREGQDADVGLVGVRASVRTERAARAGLVELIAAAEDHEVPWLVDDDEVSLGYFAASQRFAMAELPGPSQIDWPALEQASAVDLGRVALVTGTNGKTTTTRMLARIARRAGLRSGNTSTDGLFVDERLVDAGDWTGPGGARAVLRNPEVDIALLEAARGGLLRRGAGVTRCQVALITNIADDHLGEYGIFDLDGMAEAKGIITRIARPEGRVVLGADSPALERLADRASPGAPIVWFAIEPEHPRLVAARAAGGEVWAIQEGRLCRFEADRVRALCAVDQIPASLGGHARHNVLNALAAAAAARGLGLDDEAIVAGLESFGAAPTDNPGRARLERLRLPGGGTVEVLLDFAHNVAGIDAMATAVVARNQDTILSFGMAGDRSDEEMVDLGRALARLRASEVILREQTHYLRGRRLGEVPALLEQGLREEGFCGKLGDLATSEVEALDAALGRAKPGQLIVVLAHIERDEVEAWLAARDR